MGCPYRIPKIHRGMSEGRCTGTSSCRRLRNRLPCKKLSGQIMISGVPPNSDGKLPKSVPSFSSGKFG